MNLSERPVANALFFFSFIFLNACTDAEIPAAPSAANGPKPQLAYKHVASILNSRCIACHSCLESPCQMNLQSLDGVRRGAFHENAYDGLREKAVAPQRMFEDAQSEQQWRSRGFIDVLAGHADSIFMKTIRLTQIRKNQPQHTVKESQICPQSSEKLTSSMATELAMPYGLPALATKDQELLNDWIVGGVSESVKRTLPSDLPRKVLDQIKDWTKLFNAQDLKSRVVARYLYEHLFLAHLYFNESPRSFFRLVRSSTACEKNVTPISTRRPNNDPGVKDWFYCFSLDPATVVYKNHMPYNLSADRLSWLKTNFFSNNWQPTAFPSFEESVAANPLIAFREIPVAARFKFLGPWRNQWVSFADLMSRVDSHRG
jgi:hypothetical protein